MTFLSPEFLALFGVFVLAAIAPGADFASVVRESISFGRRAGIICAIGVGSAIMIHVAYTVTGVGLIIAQSVFDLHYREVVRRRPILLISAFVR